MEMDDMKERLGDLSIYGRDRVVATALKHWFAVAGTEPVDGQATRSFCLYEDGRWLFREEADAEAYAVRIGGTVEKPDRTRDANGLRAAFLAVPDGSAGRGVRVGAGTRVLTTLNDLMHAQRFDVIDEVLTEVSGGTTGGIVSLLRGTFRVRGDLAGWHNAVVVARRELERRGEQADALLVGLLEPQAERVPAPR